MSHPTYCECISGPAPYHTAGKCGRCFRAIEPELDACTLCEGEGQVLKGAGVESPGRPEIVTCPLCEGEGV